MIKPIHLLVAIAIGFLIGWMLFAQKEKVVSVDFKKLDSLHEVIKQDKKDIASLNDTLKQKEKKLDDSHIKRVAAEKKAKDAEAKYNFAKSVKPITHKDSIIYFSVTAADCDTVNVALKGLVSSYSMELEKSEGIVVTLKEVNKKLTSENDAYAKADSLHVQTEKALVKKARKNLFKGGLFGVIGSILVVLIL